MRDATQNKTRKCASNNKELLYVERRRSEKVAPNKARQQQPKNGKKATKVPTNQRMECNNKRPKQRTNRKSENEDLWEKAKATTNTEV